MNRAGSWDLLLYAESNYELLHHLSGANGHAIQLLAEELQEKLSVYSFRIDIFEEAGMEPFG